MRLPISVVVPHLLSRDSFFQRYCLPSIWMNSPAEVLVVSDDSHVQVKRNMGAVKATQEFLFFCDDDVILADGCLAAMYKEIGDHDFAYCDYLAANHPTPKFLKHTARPFDVDALRRQNYISTMSLVRRSKFPGFDESIQRLQDWDMFLTMTERGSTGVYVKDAEFIAFWLDRGITSKGNWENSNQIVKRKHGIGT